MQLNNLIKYKSCITVQFPTFAGTNWITCMKSDEDTVLSDGWKVIVGGERESRLPWPVFWDSKSL